MTTDRSLREDIENYLGQDVHLSAFNIQVEVHKGFATLRGVVPTSRSKLAAHELVESVPGCYGVINELEVWPAGGASDVMIADAVRHALDLHPEVTKGAITVRVEGGLVALSGAVATSREYAAAEEAARSTRGVRDVLNLLIIDRDAQDEDETLRLGIQSAIDAEEELHGSDISVSVSGDLVVLAGHVANWRQRELAAEVALGIRPWRLRNEIVVEEAHTAT